MPAVLGISALYHDSAAALVVDGEIVAASQEERFTRLKHDARMPESAVAYCLAEAGLEPGDLDLVGYYEKPLLKFDRILETYLTHAPHGFRSFARGMPTWLDEKLFVRKSIRQMLPGYKRRIAFLEHHESHAASAFFPSPFDRAAILTLDGVGEWATGSYGVGEGQHVRILATQSFPDSVGLLYSAFTAFCGFKVNSGEYKLMGLAPYGDPRFAGIIRDRLVDIRDDGAIRLDQSYFDYAVGLRTTNAKFAKLFGGPPRVPESSITQREMDLAASIQVVVNEIVCCAARHVRKVTGESKLCLAGGVALNCVATRQLIEEQIFDEVWTQPAAGDAGGALGTALALSCSALGVERDRVATVVPTSKSAHSITGLQRDSLFGPSFTDDEISKTLMTLGAKFKRFDHDESLDSEVARLLDDGLVVGWFQGRMEFGPRALGSRSILGDPRRAELQKVMNLKIKFRESFRPFAPIVMEEHASEYFDFGPVGKPQGPHRYMLATVGVAASQLVVSEDGTKLEVHDQGGDSQSDSDGRGGSLEDLPANRHALPYGPGRATHVAGSDALIDRLNQIRSAIPAVTHVDNSARVQVVSKSVQGRLWALLDAFRQRTGCPVLINTSFNVRDEPIVCTPEDAYLCFMSTGMDGLAMGSFLLLKSEQK